jgi:hypothetical protein
MSKMGRRVLLREQPAAPFLLHIGSLFPGRFPSSPTAIERKIILSESTVNQNGHAKPTG